MKPLVVIPARGGSKGLPDKNIKPLAGKPLIHYTIEAARAVFPDEVIYLSTDSTKIKTVAEETGLTVPFLRPAALATDTAGTYEVLLHALDFAEQQRNYKPEVLVLLQPTSPLRTAQHIREALAQYATEIDMVVSVKETKANPYYVLFEENTQGYLEKSKTSTVTRRQDLPKVWEYNGAIYIMNVGRLRERSITGFQRIRKYVMEEMSSVDIDTEMDFVLAEYVLQAGIE